MATCMINDWLHYFDVESNTWIPFEKPEPMTLWQRIKKHGLKARIF